MIALNGFQNFLSGIGGRKSNSNQHLSKLPAWESMEVFESIEIISLSLSYRMIKFVWIKSTVIPNNLDYFFNIQKETKGNVQYI